MKRKFSRIIMINLLLPILALSLLSVYLLQIGIDQLVNTFLPYTFGIFLITAIAFIVLAIHNIHVELSREKIKHSYNAMDEQYQRYIESTADGFIFVDESEKLTVDKTIISMLGYSASENIELMATDVINKDADGLALLENITNLNNDIASRYQTRLLRKDGKSLEVLISASRIETHNMRGFILIVKDMSDTARTDAVRINTRREYSIIELQSALQYIYQDAGTMMSDLLSFKEDEKIINAVKKMNEEHKNTFIVVDANGYPSGFVTDQDLRQRVISGEIKSDAAVKQVMSSPVITAEPNIKFFEAFRQMRDNSIRQLVIIDGEGKPAGILTEKQLLQTQSTNSAVLFEELKRAKTVDELRDCYRRLMSTVETLVLSGAKAVNIAGVVSRTAETITQKLIEMSFRKLGPPSCSFAFLVMGSEGRGEQTLITDQDNGIIFSDVQKEKTEACRKYFLRLGKMVSDNLNYIGYAYCKGNVMASNPHWVRSETEWSEQVWSWVNGEGDGNMLDVNILFDFKCIYGDKDLSRRLRHELWEAVTRFPDFLRRMVLTVSELKPPLTIFGRLQVKKTEQDDEFFDIKKVIGPLIIYARTMSLRARIPETATIARLRELKNKEIITKSHFRNYEQAFEFLTLLRFREQVEAIREGEQLDNLIYIKDLSDVEIISLQKIFKQIAKAQDELRVAFTGSMRGLR